MVPCLLKFVQIQVMVLRKIIYLWMTIKLKVLLSQQIGNIMFLGGARIDIGLIQTEPEQFKKPTFKILQKRRKYKNKEVNERFKDNYKYKKRGS